MNSKTNETTKTNKNATARPKRRAGRQETFWRSFGANYAGVITRLRTTQRWRRLHKK